MPPQGGIIRLSNKIKKKIKFQVMPPQGGIYFRVFVRAKRICFKSCPRKGASDQGAFAPERAHKFQVMPP